MNIVAIANSLIALLMHSKYYNSYISLILHIILIGFVEK